MPSGVDYERTVNYHDNAGYSHDESAASILQSVKEQEAQFEQLTRELEAERQSVANQLDRCKFGSETASMSSISSTDESFRWHGPQSQTQDSHIDEEGSDNESRTSGSALVDSCLRVLQERGLMNTGYEEDPMDRYYEGNGTPVNGGYNYGGYERNTDSPHGSLSSQQRTQVTTVVTTRQIQRTDSPANNYASYSSLNHGPPEGAVPQQPRDKYTDRQYPNQGQQQYADDHPQGDVGNYSNYPNDHGDYANDPYPADDRYYPADQYNDMPPNYNEPGYYPDNNMDNYQRLPPGQEPEGSYHSAPSREESYRGMAPEGQYPAAPPREDSYRGLAPDEQYRAPSREESYRGLAPDDQYRAPSREESYRGLAPDDQYQYQAPSREESYRGLAPDDQYRAPSRDGSYRGPAPEDPYHAPPRHDSYNPIAEEPYQFNPSREVSYRGPEDQYQQPPSREDSYRGPHPDESFHGPEDQMVPQSQPEYRNPPLNDYTDGANPKGQRSDSPAGSDLNGPPGYNTGPRPYDEGPYSSDPYQGEGDPRQIDPRALDNERYVNASPYGEKPRGYEDGPQDYGDAPQGYGDEPNRYPGEQPPYGDNPYMPESGRRSPSNESAPEVGGVRNPDLPEVIEFLGHPNDAVKANAAAYLQHLTFNDDSIKAKTRTLNGIHALVGLVNNDIPEVHRNSCGALRNLSYGKANEENKRAIMHASGIPALVRLLRKTRDNDVRELVTAVLWNLSSCKDVKQQIIDDAMAVLVNTVIIPHSGFDSYNEDQKPPDVYWSTVFRNASGVLRNVSSDGDAARKKLRECEGLVDSLLCLVKAAIGKFDIDNKSVENCVCVLRNLSFRMQEVDDPDFIQKRTLSRKQNIEDGEKVGCFGGSKKKDQKAIVAPPPRNYRSPHTGPMKGMELLWQPEIVHVYLPLLSDCSNPETLEASAGAIQNLTACDWQPAVDLRAAVRKEKGLPIIVELLSIEADRVVCASAMALRNLALDTRNKELIGKYAMRQLVMKLPTDSAEPEIPTTDDTIAAVISTLHEVIRKNLDFASTFFQEGGVNRLIHITKSQNKYSLKVVKFAATLLRAMWTFKDLHAEYRKQGWKEAHFTTKTLHAKPNSSTLSSANNTMNRPRSDQSGGTEGYKDRTLPPVNRQNPNYRDDRLAQPSPDKERFGVGNGRKPESVPLSDLNTSGGYATIDSHKGHEDYDRVPQGSLSMYPMGSHQSQLDQNKEPLYAQVNKNRKPRQDGYMDSNYSLQNASAYSLDGPAGGADSWV